MRGLLATCLTLAALPAAGDPVLSFPVDCELGETCHIQQYVDRAGGEAARDFTCGPLSYDGHKGTDFSLPSLRAMQMGVNVLAAAPGQVRGVRNNMADRYYTRQNAHEIDGRECGNGVVLVHEDGWETQYCHLKQGSVRVQAGDTVARGAVLGQVGLSGKTQFPHLHLSVRHDGKVIDPFEASGSGICGAGGETLWQDTPDYVPGAMISSGFAPHMPEYEAVQAGDVRYSTLPADSPALVLYGYAFGGQTGDIVQLEITGPNGRFAEHEVVLERNRARFFRAFGRRLRDAAWPSGDYTGTVTLKRNGQEISRSSAAVSIE